MGNQEKIISLVFRKRFEAPERIHIEVVECKPEILSPRAEVGKHIILSLIDDGFDVLINPMGIKTTNPVERDIFDWTEMIHLLEEGKSVLIKHK